MPTPAQTNTIYRETDTGKLARRLIGALRHPQKIDLRRQLRLVRNCRRSRLTQSTLEEERLDLLSAVADDLNLRFAESGFDGATFHPRSVEVAAHLWLLRHLARGSASP